MNSCLKELEDENQRLKKMYFGEKLKAEIVSEALEKSGEAIPMTCSLPAVPCDLELV